MDSYSARYAVRQGYRRALRHRRGPEPLLLVGHHRCGSARLNRLLLTSSEITGLGERLLRYHTSEALTELAPAVYADSLTLRMKHRFVVDQVNESRLLPDPAVVADSWQIVVVRDPASTVLEMNSFYAGHWFWRRGMAERYYVRRLAELQGHLRSARTDRLLAVTFDQLVADSAAVAAETSRFLGLRGRLSDPGGVTGTPTRQRGDIRQVQFETTAVGSEDIAVEPELQDAYEGIIADSAFRARTGATR